MAKFRTNADRYTDVDALQYAITFDPSEGVTQPEFALDCDINTIISRYQAVQAPLPISDISEFTDYTQVGDYQTALQSIVAIDGYFDSLPATIRARFANDPAELMRFLDQPQNRSEAEILGLIQPLGSPVSQTVSGAVAGVGSGEGNALPDVVQ